MSLLLNICKYNNCGLIYPNLSQLIQHIEQEHINYDAAYIEKLEMAKPAALPLSYVLPSNIELLENIESDEEYERPPSSTALTEIDAAEQHNSDFFPLADDISANNSISESADVNFEDEIDPDDTFTFDFIMRYGSKRTLNQFDEKPFACPMPLCTKRYKNVNGLRYHARNGHKKNLKPAKKYECYCGRGYKTAQGLRAHAMALHNIAQILPTSSSLAQADETLSLLTFANLPNDTFDQIHEEINQNENFKTEKVLADTTDAKELDLNSKIVKDEKCLDAAALIDFKNVKVELETAEVENQHAKTVFCFKRFKIEHDENSSSSNASSICQENSDDVDEKCTMFVSSIERVKSKKIDDDEIDVGDANDTIYPYYH